MTTPRYASTGCVAGSQVAEDASPAYAWGVNLNNGNANINNRNNDGLALPVSPLVPSPGECPSAQGESITLKGLHDAWRAARRGKAPSAGQARFEADWCANLIELQDQINAGTWSPGPTACFVARQPKAREIHAPAFRDRVVHHWLVPKLEAVYEPRFIAHSYANRVGKGTHAAVQQLLADIRQVHSGQCGGWYLQLDVRNFFNSVHRPTLWRLLKRALTQAQAPQLVLRLVHALLRRSPLQQGVVHRSTAAERAQVPPEKRLENAPADCGLPIGNLSSQFFANVYLDALDQFIKHQLKARRYVRFADDFVLVHHRREQLQAWRDQIEAFLRDHLRLRLKAEQKLQPLASGIDFLGYILHPTHTRVRRRVIVHARQRIEAWQRDHIRPGRAVATPAQLREISAVWGSYQGHLQHANAWRLQQGLHQRFPWLEPLTRVRRRFDVALEGRSLQVRIP